MSRIPKDSVISHTFSHSDELPTICILPSWQKKGLSSKLFKYVVFWRSGITNLQRLPSGKIGLFKKVDPEMTDQNSQIQILVTTSPWRQHHHDITARGIAYGNAVIRRSLSSATSWRTSARGQDFLCGKDGVPEILNHPKEIPGSRVRSSPPYPPWPQEKHHIWRYWLPNRWSDLRD